MRIVETNQEFGITLFLKPSLINLLRCIRQPLIRRGEKLFEEKDMMMVYLRKGRIPTYESLPSRYIMIETRGQVLLKREGLIHEGKQDKQQAKTLDLLATFVWTVDRLFPRDRDFQTCRQYLSGLSTCFYRK